MACCSEVTSVIKAQPVPLSTSPELMVKRNKLQFSERKKFPWGEANKPVPMSHKLPEPVQGAWLVHSLNLGRSSKQSWAAQTQSASHSGVGTVAGRSRSGARCCGYHQDSDRAASVCSPRLDPASAGGLD